MGEEEMGVKVNAESGKGNPVGREKLIRRVSDVRKDLCESTYDVQFISPTAL